MSPLFLVALSSSLASSKVSSTGGTDPENRCNVNSILTTRTNWWEHFNTYVNEVVYYNGASNQYLYRFVRSLMRGLWSAMQNLLKKRIPVCGSWYEKYRRTTHKILPNRGLVVNNKSTEKTLYSTARQSSRSKINHWFID